MRVDIPFRQTTIALVILLLGLLASCASTPKREAVIYEGRQGAVYLEALSPAAARADHPVTIDASTLGLVLSALYIQDEEGMLQSLLAGKAKPVRVFSDEEVRFLAPLLATAFSKAASHQQVAFSVVHPVDGGREMTKASVFASGPSLHLTLDQYRDNPNRLPPGEAAGRRLPDRTGLAHRTVLFLPEAAGLDDREQRFARRGLPPVTLVVNYDLLKKAAQPSQGPMTATEGRPTAGPPSDRRSAGPAPESSPHEPPSTGAVKSEGPAHDLQALKELIVQKDLEIEALKGELRELRRRMQKNETEPKTSPKRTPKKSAPNGTP